MPQKIARAAVYWGCSVYCPSVFLVYRGHKIRKPVTFLINARLLGDGEMADTHQLGPLLNRARHGERDSITQLAEKLRPWIRQQAAITLEQNPRGSFDASDVAQSVCLKLCTRFVQFRGDTVPKLLAWIGRITRNAVATKLRSRLPTQPTPSSFIDGVPDSQAGKGDPSAAASDAVALADALDALPEAYRVVIELRFFKQLSFDQISQITGRTPGALRVACLRAIERLRT